MRPRSLTPPGREDKAEGGRRKAEGGRRKARNPDGLTSGPPAPTGFRGVHPRECDFISRRTPEEFVGARLTNSRALKGTPDCASIPFPQD
jgi:hypothetical protein